MERLSMQSRVSVCALMVKVGAKQGCLTNSSYAHHISLMPTAYTHTRHWTHNWSTKLYGVSQLQANYFYVLLLFKSHLTAVWFVVVCNLFKCHSLRISPWNQFCLERCTVTSNDVYFCFTTLFQQQQQQHEFFPHCSAEIHLFNCLILI